MRDFVFLDKSFKHVLYQATLELKVSAQIMITNIKKKIWKDLAELFLAPILIIRKDTNEMEAVAFFLIHDSNRE